jgi:hypothetical protein
VFVCTRTKGFAQAHTSLVRCLASAIFQISRDNLVCGLQEGLFNRLPDLCAPLECGIGRNDNFYRSSMTKRFAAIAVNFRLIINLDFILSRNRPPTISFFRPAIFRVSCDNTLSISYAYIQPAQRVPAQFSQVRAMYPACASSLL